MTIATAYVASAPSLSVLVFAAFYGLIQQGVVLANTAEDYPEDLEAGVRTSVVALGIDGAVSLACAMVLVGGGGVLGTLASIARDRGVAPLGSFALVPIAVGCSLSNVALFRLRWQLVGASFEEKVAAVRRAGKKVPLWLTFVAWASFFAALELFRASTPP
jgi:4-hydroxybenzoate polyprenyltransferase